MNVSPRDPGQAIREGGVAECSVPSNGRVIGSYRLEDEIGRGGMGVVHRATRLDTGEAVALKLMLPEIAANLQFRARFVREASLGSDLDHPNIVPIYDAGDVDGELFLAMRLVEGRDLKQLLEEEGRLDPWRLLAILRQVAAALDAAHEAGIVHHDIKPQNVLVSPDGKQDLVFVTDFGLVKPAGSESTNSRTGTRVFGSIQYMPPEQVEGLPADGRADVYALGCVIFECLTGSIPFDRPNEVAVLWAHVHEDPSRVTDLRSELPGGLDEVVARAMAKRPEDRFLTCGELVEAFENGLQRTARTLVMPIVKPLVKRVPRRKTEGEVWAPNYFPELSRVRKLTDKTNWLQVTSITSILCLLAAALVHFAHPRGIGGAVNDVALAVGEKVLSAGKQVSSAFDEDLERERGPRERPNRTRENVAVDGATLAEGAARSDRDAFSRGEIPFTTKRVGTPPVLSGANANLVVTGGLVTADKEEKDLYRVDATGGDPVLLTDDEVDQRGAVWSPDGRKIAYVSPRGIEVMDRDGSGKRLLIAGGGLADWSPDGTKVAYMRRVNRSGGTPAGAIYIYDLSTRRSTYVAPTGVNNSEIDWSPDGRRLVFQHWREVGTGYGAHVMVVDVDGSDLMDVTVASGGRNSDWRPSWTLGGRIVFTRYGGCLATRCADFYLVNADGSGLEALGLGSMDWNGDGSPDEAARLRQSPDGSMWAAAVTPGDVGSVETMQLWTLDRATGATRKLFAPLYWYYDWQPGCTIEGSGGADVLTGTSGRDVICGLGGDDVIRGLGGNDVVFGHSGSDRITGGSGADIVVGNEGRDRCDRDDTDYSRVC